MAFKDTIVEFSNNTNKPLTIRPAGSSLDRFQEFTLRPLQSNSLRDSNPGLSNYDIEWDVLINPKGKRNDLLVGSFRADNPWYGKAYIQSSDKKLTLAMKYKSDAFQYPTRTVYYEGMNSAYASESYLGVFDPKKAFKGYLPGFSTPSGIYSSGFLDAYKQDLPYAKVENLGVVDGAYKWVFEINYM